MRNIEELMKVSRETAREVLDGQDHGTICFQTSTQEQLNDLDRRCVTVDGEMHLDILEALLVTMVYAQASEQGSKWQVADLVEYLDRPDALEEALAKLEEDKTILNFSPGKGGRVWIEEGQPRNLMQLYALCVRVREEAAIHNNAQGLPEILEIWKNL